MKTTALLALLFTATAISAQNTVPELKLLPKQTNSAVIQQPDTSQRKYLIADSTKIRKNLNYHPDWKNAPITPEIHWYALENKNNERYWNNVYADRLLIEFKKGTSLNQKTIKSFLKENKLDSISHKSMFPEIQNYYEFYVNNASRKRLLAIIKKAKRISDILYAEPVPVIKSKAFIPNDPHFFQNGAYHGQWDMTTIRVDSVWGYYRGGSSNILAVVDDAVDLIHPDLYNQVWYGYDFGMNDNDPSYDYLSQSHGSHVTGTVAAEINNGIGVAGMTNDTIFFAKTSDGEAWDNNCSCYTATLSSSGILDAVNYISTLSRVKAVNMSYGGYYVPTQATINTYSNAWNSGKVLIAAAGNDAKNSTTDPMYPACFNSYVISVSSVGVTNGGVLTDASYSNFGPDIDISAPGGELNTGYGIRSAIPNSYDDYQGTSMAAPHVTGLAGIVADMNPFLTNVGIRSILEQEVIDLGTAGFDPLFGYGMICAWCAYEEACNQLPAYLNMSISGSTTFCQGGSVTFTATNNSHLTYKWKINNTVINGATSNIYTATQSGSYVLEILSEGGCMVTFTPVVVAVNPIPNPTISPPSVTICSGQSSTLTASGGGTYSWSNSLGSNSQVTVSPSATTTYTVTVTANGCNATASRTVNVNSSPSASISPSFVTICNGQSATLTASGGGTYLWSNSLGTNAQATVSPSTTTTYTVTVTANGCTATASRAVNVNTIPSANISPTTASICNGSNITLTASGGGTYSWSNSLGANSQVTVSPTSTTTYTVTVTLNSCTATATKTVTVNQIPTANISPTTATICNGSSITLTASGGGTYAWSNSLGTNSQISVSPTSPTTYTVTVTSNNCSATASRSVSVNPKPNAPTFSPTSGCNPVTVTANSTNCTGCSYNWSTGETVATATFTITSNYTVTATNSNNCTASANGTITITGQPSVSITSPVTGFCTGSTATLSTNPTSTAYSWSGPNGFTSSSPQVTVNTGGSYSVTVTNPGACTGTATASFSITQYPTPNASAGNDVTIQQDSSTTLTATGGGTYLWSNGSTSQSITVSPSTTTPYTVTVTDGNNCTATDNVTVSVQGACNNIYTLSSSTVTVPASGGNCSTNISTDAACSWNVNAGGCIGWVTPINLSGTGAANISFTVQPNTLPSQRTCFATIEGNLFSIIQAAVSVTDIQDISAIKNILLFPNPNNGEFTLSIESVSTQKVNTSVFNSLGQLIQKKEIETNTQTEFDLSANAKGIYYLQLQSEGRNYYVKVSVE